MKLLSLLAAVLAMVVSTSCVSASSACPLPATVCDAAAPSGFDLIRQSRPAAILIDDSADPAVRHAANSFRQDLARVSGQTADLLHEAASAPSNVVVIGVLNDSPLIDGLVQQGKLDASAIDGQWEAFQITTVDQPWPGVRKALVIAGADRRGAVFGTYDVSEEMGVSPWYWFADVPIEQKANIRITSGQRMEKPGIRYRGFFINDEDPAFSGWAKARFGGVNADMYEPVFELLLRMKGNYIWPAMWAPKSFHMDDPRGADLAHEMGVVMGTSHHEPLSRAQAEWHRLDQPYAGGDWNYQTNAENLREFWRTGLERLALPDGRLRDNLLTVGMRGDGDEPMSEGTAIELLERVVADQRRLIGDVTGKPASETPQMWALYKEVQDYYDQGMTVPDDVTLLFADDNWGQIRRLPTKQVDRPGGFGVYYHFDYVGGPRNYKWLNTSQIGKVWQQMNLAYERGARDIWIVNVGDIKPMEYPLDFFMEMAWAPDKMTPETLAAYPQDWAAQQFGADVSHDIAHLVTEYSRLAARRKPELVNEDTYSIGEIKPDVLVRGEWNARVADWRALVADMEAVKPRIPEDRQSAFFQLVEFPVLAMSNLYEMYHATAWNRALAAQFDPRGDYFAIQVETAFARDSELAEQYHALNDRKWDHMMSQVHMNYVIWNDPAEQTQPAVVRTAGDVPEQMRNAEPVFVDRADAAKSIALSAKSASRSVPAADVRWVPVPDLGQAGAALVAMPQGRPASDPALGPRAEFDVTLPENDGLTITLRLLPALNTRGPGPLRVGLSIGDQEMQVLEMDLEPTGGAQDTPAKQRWAAAVVDNGVTLQARFAKLPAGPQSLRLHRIDDNIIVESIQIDPF
ncbi:MAG: glycosyl hydrolase 115 family protein [Hyphomonas sp.]|nr:glycosyl hydrolase 115 family protein [Hyphomonas sp.]